jgi:hypothetical protein
VTAAFKGDLRKLLAEAVRAAETAVTEGVKRATDGLKGELRQQVTNAGLAPASPPVVLERSDPGCHNDPLRR